MGPVTIKMAGVALTGKSRWHFVALRRSTRWVLRRMCEETLTVWLVQLSGEVKVMLRITLRVVLGKFVEVRLRNYSGSALGRKTRGNSKKALTGVLKGMLVRITLKQCEKAERAAGRKEWCILKIYRRG